MQLFSSILLDIILARIIIFKMVHYEISVYYKILCLLLCI